MAITNTIMTIHKVCPQCGDSFDGRSNQLYCSSVCKQRAFKAGLTQRSQTVPATANPVSSPVTYSVNQQLDPTTAKVYESLRLQSAERMKELELEDKEQEYEREIEREDREFQRERERAQWERESLKLQLSQQPLESLPIDTDQKDKESDESGMGLGEWALIGLGGMFIINILKRAQAVPPPPSRQMSTLKQLMRESAAKSVAQSGSETDQ